MSNNDDASDAVQDALLKALQHRKSVQSEDLKPWFMTIVRNQCFNRLKRTRRRMESLDNAEFDESSSPPDALIAEVFRRADEKKLTEAMNQLAIADRELLILRGLEDMSYRDIATVLAIPIGTVMSRLARARSRLQALLIDFQEGVS